MTFSTNSIIRRILKPTSKALEAGGHEVFAMEGDAYLAERLKDLSIDICFNQCEGYRGDSREAQIPALLEMLGMPYVGSKVLALALTLDKSMTKRVLTYHGLPTPPFQEFVTADDPLDPRLAAHFPLFAKPNSEGTGMGIDDRSILRDEAELRERVAYLLAGLSRAGAGGEVHRGQRCDGGHGGQLSRSASLPHLDDRQLAVRSDRHARVWFGVEDRSGRRVPVSMPGADCPTSWRTNCGAWRSKRCASRHARFCAVDFRLDKNDNNQPYILEINSLPGITPISDLTLMAEAEGWSHARLVYSVLEAALKRYGLQIDVPLHEYEEVRVR